jgi:pimeloyl-ACP methyl ester carboxylesterase
MSDVRSDVRSDLQSDTRKKRRTGAAARRLTWASACAAACASAFAIAQGCSSSSESPAPSADGGDAGDGDNGVNAIAIASPCTDSLDSIYGDPGSLAGPRGAILKCAHEKDFSRDDLEALARKSGYAGRPFTSGARAYRVVFRTERGDAAGSPGYSSASVLVPDTPRAPSLPVIVAAHGTAGESGICALSKTNVSPDTKDVVTVLLAGIAGGGYAVITPDYAGYSNYGAPGNPASGEFLSADVGKTVLDAARALRKLVPAAVSDKVALVGHSEGGHSVLSALAMAEAYGADGTIVGVATYAPLWFNQASWGAMLAVPNQFPLMPPDGGSVFPIAVGVWYHYSHGEVLDGPGHGVDVFDPSKRDAIKKFFDTTCVGNPLKNDGDFAQLKALGSNVADLYDPAFAQSVKLAAGLGGGCDPGDTTCERWIARYAADRPHLTGNAARTPVLVVYGSADITIPPERMVCGLERLKNDGVGLGFCYVAGADHSGVVEARSDYVNDWVASLALGGAPPAPCASDYAVLADDAGAIKCATPPPND